LHILRSENKYECHTLERGTARNDHTNFRQVNTPKSSPCYILNGHETIFLPPCRLATTLQQLRGLRGHKSISRGRCNTVSQVQSRNHTRHRQDFHITLQLLDPKYIQDPRKRQYY
jgi:hypothetical protein